MSLRKKINDQLNIALKSKKKILVSTLRLILAAIKDRDIANRSSSNKEEIEESDILNLLKKMRKQRTFQELREVSFETNINLHAEGSCLVKFGNTHVLCTASIDEKTPPWLRNSGKGWVTAEYGMLPRSTNTRIDREAAKGKQSGRTQEIQILIGRSLRSIINLENLG